MGKGKNIFYEENKEFVNDIIDYCKIIEKEFCYIINEVSENTLENEFFNVGIIPFKSNVNGLLISSDNKSNKEFECDDIRSEIGGILPNSKEMYEFEIKNNCYLKKNKIDIKKCEIYYESKKKFPLIYRHRGSGNPTGHELIQSKMETVTSNNNALFVSDWIEFGPFLVFFVSKLNETVYLKYRELANTIEKDDKPYKYFLNALIDNFFNKWLEFVYYGLYYSTTNYISDSQAIITATANDMFESRQIPTEHLFTKIANYEYEGAPCRGKIVFTDSMDGIIKFKQPIELSINNVKKIRKLLEMSNNNTCLIMNGRELVGVDCYIKHKEAYLIEFIDINMWNFSYGGKYIVKYNNGQYRLPINKFDRQVLIKKCNKKFNGKYNKKIVDIIKVASNQKHGTMVIISQKAKEESATLVSAGKGIAIYETDLIKADKDLVLGLCSIDGAIMIDQYGKCSGIGLILSNPSLGKGNPERGARYNSAINYINTNKDSIAIVISEDGMVDIL